MGLLIKFLIIAAIIWAAGVAYLYARQDKFMFFPDPRAYTQDQVGVSGFIDVSVMASDGVRVQGWYARASSPGLQTILFFHGNASTYQWRARDFAPLINAGYGVLLAGYRGYGGNKGEPSEAGFYKDADAYLQYLTATERLAPQQIVVYGESLGTGVAIDLASRNRDLGGLILEAPYTSMPELAALHYRFVPYADKLTRNKFESIYKIGAITMPKLFLLAGWDTVVPPENSERLWEQAPPPRAKKIYGGAGHNEIRASGALADVQAFLQSIN